MKFLKSKKKNLDNELVFVILNSGFAGALVTIGLQYLAFATHVPTLDRVIAFVIYLAFVLGIVWTSTRYYMSER